jgi:hypothetical protein
MQNEARLGRAPVACCTNCCSVAGHAFALQSQTQQALLHGHMQTLSCTRTLELTLKSAKKLYSTDGTCRTASSGTSVTLLLLLSVMALLVFVLGDAPRARVHAQRQTSSGAAGSESCMLPSAFALCCRSLQVQRASTRSRAVCCCQEAIIFHLNVLTQRKAPGRSIHHVSRSLLAS